MCGYENSVALTERDYPYLDQAIVGMGQAFLFGSPSLIQSFTG
jgi:hypothetical protein